MYVHVLQVWKRLITCNLSSKYSSTSFCPKLNATPQMSSFSSACTWRRRKTAAIVFNLPM